MGGPMAGLRWRTEVLLLLLSLGHSQYDITDLDAEKMKFFRLYNETRILDECYYVDHEYSPVLPGNGSCYKEQSLAVCQSGCQASPNCSYFTYWQPSQRCCWSGSDAYYKWAPGVGAVTGPKICPEVPSGCTELPDRNFPGATETESEDAWPSHRVPQKLECWPQNWTASAFHACEKIKVVESSDDGFPGRCTDLTQIPVVPQFESCESLCRKQPFCSMFQTRRSDGPYGPKSCWHGYLTPGTNCYVNRDANFIPIRAKRFVQGDVRVLANTTEVQVMGLTKVFDPYYFQNVSDLVNACKISCYSYLLCQYWQYYKLSGCWMEIPPQNGAVLYPPTTEAWKAETPVSDTILGGEYIQHTCVAAKGTVEKPTIAPEPIKHSSSEFHGQPLYGGLAISGIEYENLTAEERVSLRKVYADCIANSLNASKDAVLDLAGDPNSVTLFPGLAVKFKVETNTGLTQDQLVDALLNNTLLEELEDATVKVLHLRGTEIGENLKVETTTEHHAKKGKNLPWYCGIFLAMMIGACVCAGLYGYVASQEEEDDMSHYDGGSDVSTSPLRSTGGFLPLQKHVDEEVPAYHSKGAGKGGNGGSEFGFRSAAREVVANTQGAIHRAEERIQGMLPHGSNGSGQAGSAPGFTRDQLMQYAHQGPPA